MPTIVIKIDLPDTFECRTASYVITELEAAIRSSFIKYMSVGEIGASSINSTYYMLDNHIQEKIHMSNILNSREKIKGYCVSARAANDDELMFYVPSTASAHRSWVLEVDLATMYTLPEAFATLDKIKSSLEGSQQGTILVDTLRVYVVKELVEIVNENENFINDILYEGALKKLSTAEVDAVRIRLQREGNLDKQDAVEDGPVPGTTGRPAKLGGSYR